MGGEAYAHTFRFAAPLPKLQAGKGHWRAVHAERQGWHRRVAEAVMVERARPKLTLQRARIVCTRHSFAQPDFENLAHSFKALLDGFVKCGVLQDDNPLVLVDQEYRWEPAPRGGSFLTVLIEEIQ